MHALIATLGLTYGLLPQAGIGATLASDRYHLAADVGAGGAPYAEEQHWARIGGNFRLGDGERNQLRLQPMIGYQLIRPRSFWSGTASEAPSNHYGSLTLGTEGIHWFGDHLGLYGRFTGGVAANTTTVRPELALSFGLAL